MEAEQPCVPDAAVETELPCHLMAQCRIFSWRYRLPVPAVIEAQSLAEGSGRLENCSLLARASDMLVVTKADQEKMQLFQPKKLYLNCWFN